MEKTTRDDELFSLEKVKALKAYFTQCRAGLKGRPEWDDYDIAAKICDQLAARMQDGAAHGKPARKQPQASAPEA
jgi:hypothetical protein